LPEQEQEQRGEEVVDQRRRGVRVRVGESVLAWTRLPPTQEQKMEQRLARRQLPGMAEESDFPVSLHFDTR